MNRASRDIHPVHWPLARSTGTVPDFFPRWWVGVVIFLGTIIKQQRPMHYLCYYCIITVLWRLYNFCSYFVFMRLWPVILKIMIFHKIASFAFCCNHSITQFNPIGFRADSEESNPRRSELIRARYDSEANTVFRTIAHSASSRETII